MPMHVCGARTRDGDPCKNVPVHGAQRCRMHGGASPGRPVIHGRYSLAHRAALADKMRAFLEDPRPGDLSHELALMRALLADFLDRFPTGQPLPAKEIERIMAMIAEVSRLVERISRIQNATALTAAEVRLLEAVLADLLTRYLDDPTKRLRFLDELQEAVGRDSERASAYLGADGALVG